MSDETPSESTIEVTWTRPHAHDGGACNDPDPELCTEDTDSLIYQCPADFDDNDDHGRQRLPGRPVREKAVPGGGWAPTRGPGTLIGGT